MANTVPQRADRDPLLKADMPRRMAKAELRKAEISFRVLLGAAIERARRLCGWSLKELAGKIDRDERQVARWISGTERPHLDVLFALPAFQQPLVIALAEQIESGVEIDTVIRLRVSGGRR